MPEPNVRVEGLARLSRTLKQCAGDVQDLKDAHAKAGAIVADAAKAGAPRRSGALAGSVRAAKQARRARVMAGGARVPYAAVIHWGWPAHSIEANPFISEAAQQTQSRWYDAYVDDVKAALAKVKGA